MTPGQRLIKSAEQALEFAAGKADQANYRIHIPDEINVKRIREETKMSQAEFARHFGFSIRTLQEWEQGRSTPRGVSRNFLILLHRAPELVREALLQDGALD